MFSRFAVVGMAVLCGVTVLAMNADGQKSEKPASESSRYFEMRTYHANPGKLKALNTRFREHTNALFQKHGMEIIGFWEPVDKKDTLTYILAYPSKEARDVSWKAFEKDPEWVKAKAASEVDGALVNKVDQVFMTPTDYSPIK
jgi:hypothetical protein